MIVRRNTRQREYVLDAVRRACNHPTAEQIRDEVAKKCANISLTTVYRNLNLLSDEGQILRLTIPNEPDRFDKTVDAHYHICCEDCGRFEDVMVPYCSDIDRSAGELSGYRITGHSIIFRGKCAACRND